MKKAISILLVVILAISMVSLVGCSDKDPDPASSLKFGLGVISVYGSAKNADGELKGNQTVTTTAAAVIIDSDGKVIKCDIDAVDGKIEFTSAGELVAVSEYKTKGEQKTDYGMSSIGKLEWNVQVDNFEKFAVGKTLNEIKAWVLDDGKGNDDVIAAGCTIIIQDFVKAIEKAINNAKDTTATANDSLSVAIITKQEKAANATDDKDGSVNVVNYIAGTVVSNGNVLNAVSDSVDTKLTFTNKGVTTTNTTAVIISKRELGSDYMMSQYGQDLNGDGVVKEWFEQADALDGICVGKTADEIAALVTNGYGVESVQTAGCTIAISDMAAVIIKAVK